MTNSTRVIEDTRAVIRTAKQSLQRSAARLSKAHDAVARSQPRIERRLVSEAALAR